MLFLSKYNCTFMRECIAFDKLQKVSAGVMELERGYGRIGYCKRGKYDKRLEERYTGILDFQ